MIESNQIASKHKHELIDIRSVVTHYLENGNSISLWRLPNTNQKHLIVCTEGLSLIDKISIEDSEPGFIIAPFNSSNQSYLLKANHTFTFEGNKLIESTDGINENYQSSNIAVHKKTEIPFHATKFKNTNDPEKEDYLRLVEKAIEKVTLGEFEKVVPARCKTINLDKPIDLLDSFCELCDLYPNAFVSLVSTPKTGTWLGASPELLVHVNDKSIFSTAAVAGTQLLPPNADLKSIAWTQKEIEEQALVSRYIINCFKQIRLREFEEHGPKTWQAGNLLHLKTDFKVDMAATNFTQLGSVMLKLLHPTSAVCGMPREISIDFLKENENFDRQYYSGFLGPVNYKNESTIYVNLRCLQWSQEQVRLFAGAGVTSGSIPEKEWEETEMKLNTLLRVINK